MDKTEQRPKTKVKRSINKKILIPVIILLLILVVSAGVLIYSKATGQTVKELLKSFEPEKTEHTMVLSEFLVNLNSQAAPTNAVLRINIAIKYLDEKNIEKVSAETPMIRDIILSHLRDLSVENILEEKTIEEFKSNAKESINELLNEDIVTQVYITDMIIR